MESQTHKKMPKQIERLLEDLPYKTITKSPDVDQDETSSNIARDKKDASVSINKDVIEDEYSVDYKDRQLLRCECGTKFSLMTSLLDHQRLHRHSGKSCTCAHCGETFTEFSTFMQHLEQRHGELILKHQYMEEESSAEKEEDREPKERTRRAKRSKRVKENKEENQKSNCAHCDNYKQSGNSVCGTPPQHKQVPEPATWDRSDTFTCLQIPSPPRDVYWAPLDPASIDYRRYLGDSLYNEPFSTTYDRGLLQSNLYQGIQELSGSSRMVLHLETAMLSQNGLPVPRSSALEIGSEHWRHVDHAQQHRYVSPRIFEIETESQPAKVRPQDYSKERLSGLAMIEDAATKVEPLSPSSLSKTKSSQRAKKSNNARNRKTKCIKITEGADLEISDNEKLPYVHIKNLGHGGSASVEMVRDGNTGKVYARKVFRNVHTRNLEETKMNFQNEVCIMRRLAANRHVIRLYATYLAGRELALILSPVASDGDLANFLQVYKDLVDSNGSDETEIDRLDQIQCMKASLKRAYGCLASGLEFMHKQTIRHKDIKPQNILIHQGNVIYTDFGFSLDFSAQGHSTTSGRPNCWSRRYCAPEVAEYDRRNSKSDIFSLGCVYFEIAATLAPHLIPASSLNTSFHLRVLGEDQSMFDQCETIPVVGPTIGAMLGRDPDLRPSASEVIANLRTGWNSCHPIPLLVDMYFCQACFQPRASLA